MSQHTEPSSANTSPTMRVDGGGTRFAYRDFGSSTGGGAEIRADETWSALHCVGLAGKCDASEFEQAARSAQALHTQLNHERSRIPDDEAPDEFD